MVFMIETPNANLEPVKADQTKLSDDEVAGMSSAQVNEFLALIDGLADIIIDTYIGTRRKLAIVPYDTENKPELLCTATRL